MRALSILVTPCCERSQACSTLVQSRLAVMRGFKTVDWGALPGPVAAAAHEAGVMAWVESTRKAVVKSRTPPETWEGAMWGVRARGSTQPLGNLLSLHTLTHAGVSPQWHVDLEVCHAC